MLPVHRVGRRRERRFKAADIGTFQQSESAQLRSAPLRPSVSQVVIGGTAFEPYTHLAVFYDSDAGRLNRAAPFLEDGIRSGQPTFLMAQGDVRDSYMERLRAGLGPDLDRALEAGLLTLGTAPGRTVDEAVEFFERAFWKALDNHPPMIRLVGEMGCVRDVFTSEVEMMAFEAAFNMISGRFPCIALCQYDVRAFSGPALLSALRAHPDLMGLPLRALIS